MELKKAEARELLPTNTSNGRTNELTKAINGRKLKNYGGFDDLEKTLFVIWKMIGLKEANWPTHEENQLLMNMIQKNYSYYSIQEIYLAFELAVTRVTLPFMGKGATIEHYQSFDFEYFCKILFGYRRYKENELKTLLPKQSKLKESQEISDEDFIKVNFISKFKIYEAGGYPWSFGIDVTIFDILVKLNKITIDKADKIEVGQKIKATMIQSNYKEPEDYKRDWIKRVKIHFFQQFINDLRVNKSKLNELI